MQLTVSTDIALRTLIYLGKKADSATIQEVADAFDIAKSHLMKVVMMLAAAGFIASERGRNGGISLALPPEAISVGEVVRLMENNLALVLCMRDDADKDICPLLPRCRLKKVLGKAQQAFLDTLDETTLAELI